MAAPSHPCFTTVAAISHAMGTSPAAHAPAGGATRASPYEGGGQARVHLTRQEEMGRPDAEGARRGGEAPRPRAPAHAARRPRRRRPERPRGLQPWRTHGSRRRDLRARARWVRGRGGMRGQRVGGCGWICRHGWSGVAGGGIAWPALPAALARVVQPTALARVHGSPQLGGHGVPPSTARARGPPWPPPPWPPSSRRRPAELRRRRSTRGRPEQRRNEGGGGSRPSSEHHGGEGSAGEGGEGSSAGRHGHGPELGAPPLPLDQRGSAGAAGTSGWSVVAGGGPCAGGADWERGVGGGHWEREGHGALRRGVGGQAELGIVRGLGAGWNKSQKAPLEGLLKI
ncbi:hypothetical protein PVAP13_4KG265405 [Panicum virgatum]|uniref:Uncharacterized protein n=1 Tax=Panicum virgatum TaxID=38727 RepID=A0A8T0TNE1_PANVG|nr:hypothetical protein PVAP13_4KG265405 [Panicum virgatum]